MHRINAEQLQKLLFRQAKVVSDKSIRANGQISAEELEALGGLARLVEICDFAQPPSPRKRWPMVTALGVTLLVVSLLLFARVSETEIELELALSEVSFVLPTQQVLTNVMQLSAIGLSGLREIRLPRAPDRIAQTLHASEAAEYAIRVSVASNGSHPGMVTLAPVILPAGTHVWLRYTEVPNQYRLTLEGSQRLLHVDVNGAVEIGLPGYRAEQVAFSSPTPILLQPGSNEVDLDFTLATAQHDTFFPQLSASKLSLFRIDQFIAAEHTVVRRVSTVLSGILYLESLNGLERPLRSGEGIQFEWSQGEIRTLRLHDDHIALKFHGRVHGMTTGTGESLRSLMPTYMEWLQARHGVTLLWGTTLYLLGLIVGALRWWGIFI